MSLHPAAGAGAGLRAGGVAPRGPRGLRGLRGRAGDDAEQGSATVLVLALALALVCCAVVPLTAAALSADRARAAAAADLAALAAASAPPDPSGGAPAAGCAAADRVARAQGARLLRCRALGVADVLVEVGVPLPGWVPGPPSGLVRARSRAGPVEDAVSPG